MKRQIRQGIFESNSSSSHVIVVTKNDHFITNDEVATSWKDVYDGKEYFYIDDKGEWRIWEDDVYFGRGFKICSSLEDKALYAIAEFCGDYTDATDEEKVEKINEIHDIISSVIPSLENIKLPTRWEEIYLDLEGNELDLDDVMENWDVSKDSPMRHFYKRDGKIHPAKASGNCYEIPHITGIDHQSMGLLTQFLITEGITLKEFLLNKKYVAIEDSDEVQYMSSLKESGLFNKDNIIKEYTAWQAYQDSKKLDPEFKEWLDEQEKLKEEGNDEETD